MGSSGGSDSSYYYQQQQQLLQQQQMKQSQKQHEESIALQKESLNKPTAAIQRNMSTASRNMVENQQAARSTLKGIRSTYAQYANGGDAGASGTTGKKLGS